MTASRAGRWAPPPEKGGVMVRSENVIGRIMRVISIAISVMLVVIVLVICAQTFFRYVVFKSLSWSEEVSRFLFAILVSWGICIGIQRDSLIRVDIIDKKFSPKALGIFRILYALSGMFVCAVLTIYRKTQLALGWTRSSDALQIPMAWIYIAMEIGYVLALLSAILKLLQEILSYCRMWRADKPMKGGDSL